ncbi:MAG: hypothetical protein OXC02_07260 [Rhodobacteraceae bacterium]|nr:hypothetical protein [Paracoccaceae bacterium]
MVHVISILKEIRSLLRPWTKKLTPFCEETKPVRQMEHKEWEGNFNDRGHHAQSPRIETTIK